MNLRMESLARPDDIESASAELKSVIDAASRALIDANQHVILRGATADLLAHLARQVTLELSDRQGEMATIHWLARIQDTLEVVNNLVATLPVSVAVAPARAQTPVRVLVVRITRTLEADPWRLLGRLVSNFPGLRLRLLLIPEGAPEEALRELGPAVTRQLLAIPIRSSSANDTPPGASTGHVEERIQESSHAVARPQATSENGSRTTAMPLAEASAAIVRSPRQHGSAASRSEAAVASGAHARHSPGRRPVETAPIGEPGGRSTPDADRHASRGWGLGLRRLVLYLLLAALAIAVASVAYPQQAGVLAELLRQVPVLEQWLPQPEPEPMMPAPPLPNRPAVRVEPAAPASEAPVSHATSNPDPGDSQAVIDRSSLDFPKSDGAGTGATKGELTGGDPRRTSATDAAAPATVPPTPPDPIRNDDQASRKERRAR